MTDLCSCPYEVELCEMAWGGIPATELFGPTFGLFQSLEDKANALVDAESNFLGDIIGRCILRSPTLCDTLLHCSEVAYSKLIAWLETHANDPDSCSRAYGMSCRFLKVLFLLRFLVSVEYW